MNSDLDDRSLRELIILMHDMDMTSLPDDDSISGKYVLSDRFYQKMNRLIKKVNYKRIASEVSRYAVACVAVISIVLVITRPKEVAEAARKFITWMEGMVSFQFEEETKLNDFPEYELTYVPERYKMEHNLYLKEDYMGDILYYSEDGVLDFGYMRSDAGVAVNNENVDEEIISFNDEMKIYYYKSNDAQYSSSMIWESKDKKITYSLTGDLTKAEFLKIIDGIKEKQ